MRILTSEEMRAADAHAIEELGIPSLALMEAAGAEVVRAIEENTGGVAGKRILVLCGRGSNGGDGMVAARRLESLGADVSAVLIGEISELSPDAATQAGILDRLGMPLVECSDQDDWQDVSAGLDETDLVVDALFGTGFKGPLRGLAARVVRDVNASSSPVVAVDVPSGLSGDSGEVAGEVIDAALTVTFAAAKRCHVFAPAQDHCGDLVVSDIGIPEASLEQAGSRLAMIDDELLHEIVEQLLDRPEDSHKGSFGHVVVVGGAVGRSGAPALAGMGALAAGAGLVTVATPAPCVASVAGHAPELMQIALPATERGELAEGGDTLAGILERATVLVVGPGLGTGPGAEQFLAELLDSARVPVLLDADAINLLARAGALPRSVAERPLVLTPHPGEFARLLEGLGLAAPGRQRGDERLAAALELVEEHGIILVVKGFRTLVVAAGEDALVNMTGGPGLATAGAGDVLAGLLGGFMAQGLAPFPAAAAAVHLHGRAADLAEKETGQLALRATDVLRHWPAALRSACEHHIQADPKAELSAGVDGVEAHDSGCEEETLALGEALALSLPPGSVLHLHGELGAGKTCLTKGIARGLGLDPDRVVSPSFTLVHLHAGRAGRPGLVHVDLYRISGPEDLVELGLEELPGPRDIAAVEWPERLGARAATGAVVVTLTDLGASSRRLEIRRPGGDALPPGRIAQD